MTASLKKINVSNEFKNPTFNANCHTGGISTNFYCTLEASSALNMTMSMILMMMSLVPVVRTPLWRVGLGPSRTVLLLFSPN